MAEETLVQDTSMETSVDTAVEIQADMAAPFFDEGLGAYVDPDGNPVQKPEEGKPLSNQPAQPVQKQVQKPVQPQKVKPSGFDAQFFKPDGSYDTQKANEYATKNVKLEYQPVRKIVEDKPVVTPVPGQPATTVKTWQQDVQDLHDSLYKQSLEPLDRAYIAAKNRGILTPEYEQDLRTEYSKREKELTAYVEQKKLERMQEESLKPVKEKETANALKALEGESKRVQGLIASELGGVETYNQLLFGYTDSKGQLVKGYGSDLINAMFDVAHIDQEIKSGEFTKKFQDFWTKISGNEQLVRMVKDVSLALHYWKNKDKYGQLIRSEKEKEVREQKAAQTKTPGGISGGQNLQTSGKLHPDVEQFLSGDIPSV